MSKSIFIFACLVCMNLYCFSQSRYKYEYKFSLPTQTYFIGKDTAYWKPGLDEIYLIKSTKELSKKKIEEIKGCVGQNRKEPNKCGSKNSISISIEI